MRIWRLFLRSCGTASGYEIFFHIQILFNNIWGFQYISLGTVDKTPNDCQGDDFWIDLLNFFNNNKTGSSELGLWADEHHFLKYSVDPGREGEMLPLGGWEYFYKGFMDSTVYLTCRGSIKSSSQKKTLLKTEPRSNQVLWLSCEGDDLCKICINEGKTRKNIKRVIISFPFLVINLR